MVIDECINAPLAALGVTVGVSVAVGVAVAVGVGVGGACVGVAVGVAAGDGVLLAGGVAVVMGAVGTDPFPVPFDETGVCVTRLGTI